MTAPEIRPEAEAAAAWWASRLGNAVYDLGSRDPDARRKSADTALFSALAACAFTDGQRDRFRSGLAAAIEENLQSDRERQHWKPENPQWGSYGRAIYNDYGPAPVLREAATQAGITLNMFDLPLKTCMWVNPGSVTVREGHGAETVTVWCDDNREERLMGATEGREETVRCLLVFGDQAELVPDGAEEADPARWPAADISADTGLEAADLPGRRFAVTAAERDGRVEFSGFRLIS